MNMTPTPSASRDSLPPEGAPSALGRPGGGSTPTLPASRDALPPEGVPSALGRPGGGARTRIKICGITREQDLEAAVEAGADAVGFNIYHKSPRYIAPERAAELARRLPPYVTPVLLFVNCPLAEVAAASDLVPGAVLQFHGDETPEVCVVATANPARAFVRAARIPLDPAQSFDLLRFASDYADAQAILLDAHVDGYGGGGKTFNWSRLPPSVNCHLVLSGGLTPANVIDGILQVRPRALSLAVDVSSGVEISKGIKDAAKINQFVAAVRAADAQLARNFNVPIPAA